MTSKEMRCNQLFMRNGFETSGKWELPVIKKQKLPSKHIELISIADTHMHDSVNNVKKGVHFFSDDYRFVGIYNNPERSWDKLKQYAFLLSPDYSVYAEMDIWRQLESVAHNRWMGAYWQNKGKIVCATLTWSTPSSYEFCFDGVEKGATVAIGMVGCKQSKTGFMRGYNVMLEKIQPEQIIVFGKPYPEMQGKLVVVDYLTSRKGAK